jgi:hypothetical protein
MGTEKKQTAVEWLYEELWKQTDFSLPNNIFEQAKAMEKDQIITTHFDAQPFNSTMLHNAELYYNKKFKETI